MNYAKTYYRSFTVSMVTSEGMLAGIQAVNGDGTRIEHMLPRPWKESKGNAVILVNAIKKKIDEHFVSPQDGRTLATYDVCLQPIVNVMLAVKDPKNPTEEEKEEIIRLAVQAVYEQDRLNEDNVGFLTLHSHGGPYGDKTIEDITIIDC